MALLFIARRYLFSRRQVTLITLLTGLSVAGVALGVAALIVVLSVMNGFYSFARDLLVSLDPHVRIEAEGPMRFTASDSILSVVQGLPAVAAASRYAEGKALLSVASAFEQTHQIVMVRGVEAEARQGLGVGSDAGFLGDFSLGRDSVSGRPGLVMGANLARRLGATVAFQQFEGSMVSLLSARSLEQALAAPLMPPQRVPFMVRGLVETASVYDDPYVFIGLDEARRLFGMRDALSGIEVRLHNLDGADAVQRTLQSQLPGYRVSTWYDLHRALYDVMRLEKWGASLILFFIIVVAAFNLVGSLQMVVLEKRRDIGVLAAMGLSASRIRKLFVVEGALIGLIGTSVGVLLGVSLALAQAKYGLVPLGGGPDAFLLQYYPSELRLSDVFAVAGAAFGLCVVASLYPAHRASRIPPAQAVSLP